jgi:hypothetical protein
VSLPSALMHTVVIILQTGICMDQTEPKHTSSSYLVVLYDVSLHVRVLVVFVSTAVPPSAPLFA